MSELKRIKVPVWVEHFKNEFDEDCSIGIALHPEDGYMLTFGKVDGAKNFEDGIYRHLIDDKDGKQGWNTKVICIDGDMHTYVKLSQEALYKLATRFSELYLKALLADVRETEDVKNYEKEEGEKKMLKMRLNDVETSNTINTLLTNGTIVRENDIAVFHARRKSSNNQRPLSSGGTTVVVVNFQDVGLMTGHADCSERDNYSRIGGRTLAIQRALDARNRKLTRLNS